MRMRAFARASWAAGCALAVLLAAGTGRAETVLDSEAFGGLEARALGPAVMSGRIMDIQAVPGDRLTIWIGAASGGVWKSKDGGLTFHPVFDKDTQTIGAIAVDPQKADNVWVGTGESCTRNSVSVGTGVYKTTDGGDTWQSVGLKDTEHIAAVLVHPKESDTALVCALGHLWNGNEERGVFKTKDGGKTWQKILYVNADTGCADLDMDPQDPDVIYASMWQARRYPDFFDSGGPGSGLYKSTDGGATWRKLAKGLPEGNLGRIAVAVAPSRPNRLYATVEAKKTALYRSDDMGESWVEMNSSMNIQLRPFYFSHLAVDPKDYNRVYKPGISLSVSNDGGKTFTSPFGGDFSFGGGVHSDLHAIWIHPANPEVLLLGTDGGVYQSLDRGGHWRLLRALPVGQFYHVSYDNAWPYNVYGGLQDNGSWMGPSRTGGGIAGRHWQNIGGGDGFWAFVDPTDPDYAYVQYQGGNIQRTRKSTGETRDIRPFPKEGEPKYRFNWNTSAHHSRKNPGTMYVGSQFLFRSKDRGESWERISPDLTTDDKTKQRQEQSGGLSVDNSSAENYCTIYTISESPKNGDVVWAGTDDGNLQVTRDGGKTWANVVANVPGLPRGTWVSRIEAGIYDEGTAFATFDGHRTGDMKTYVFKTMDYGKTWTSLATPDLSGHAWVIVQDPVMADLLFLGTETGLYISLDGGKHWAHFTNKLPPVPVHDLAIQPREQDLIVATHGRGIYILDDISPLRQLTPKVLDSEAVVLQSRPAVRISPGGDQRFDGDDEYVAFSPPETATIVYYLKKRHMFGDLKIEVYDERGTKISTIPGSKKRGLNRVEWPMREAPPKVPPATNLVPNEYAFLGPRKPAGTYTVKLIKGNEAYTGSVKLVEDPRSPHKDADRALQQETVKALYDDLGRLTFLVDAMVDLRDKAKASGGKLGEKDALRGKLDGFAGKIDDLRKTLVATREGTSIAGEEKLREHLGDLYGNVNGYEGRPTDSQIRYRTVLEKEIADAEAKFDGIVAKDLAGLNSALSGKKQPALERLTKDAWSKKQSGGGAGGGTMEPEAAAEFLQGTPGLAKRLEGALLGW